MHSNPDVAGAGAVDRSSVIVKITGNMIELNNPIEIASTAADGPLIWLMIREIAFKKGGSEWSRKLFFNSAINRKFLWN